MPEKPTADASMFRTTRWTRVMAARGDSAGSQVALSELCELYYAPVRAFIGRAWPKQDADDLTQAFFARFLERAGLDHMERGRGMFRSYLRGAVKHFIRDYRAKEAAVKRGGRADHVSLDDEASAVGSEPSVAAPADAFFDRDWALALIGRALDAVKAEHPSARQFDVLKPWLSGEAGAASQSAAALELGISTGAVKVAIHRLRKQVRDRVRREIADTVSSPGEVGLELNYLIEVLGQHATPDSGSAPSAE
jgi:RNA polymerase sigma-70 factor (ECF subfamily)